MQKETTTLTHQGEAARASKISSFRFSTDSPFQISEGIVGSPEGHLT